MNPTNCSNLRLMAPVCVLLCSLVIVLLLRAGTAVEESGVSVLETQQPQPVSFAAEQGAGALVGLNPPLVETTADDDSEQELPRDFGKPNPLPLPSSMSVPAFEELLFEFLNKREYAVNLGWLPDKALRDTGPYINGKYYGTHPAVRIFYSPGIIQWLVDGRQGTIPDGEMIVKEQYLPPAIRHAGKSEEELNSDMLAWTIMIKDSAGSQDGWFWGNPAKDQCVVDNHQFPFDHPLTGFGHYCVRCHGSTQSPNIESPSSPKNEFTFAALRNIEGFPGEPIIFRVDDSWRREVAEQARLAEKAKNEGKLVALVEDHDSHPKCTQTEPPARLPLVVNDKFLEQFSMIPRLKKNNILAIPPVTYDWVVKSPDSKQSLVTSNQCMSCHSGLVEPFGPSMFLPTKESETGYGAAGWSIAPYEEWRWSPMGLAGRDPVFYAQVESELAILKQDFEPETAKEVSRHVVDTCLRCHGAMGKRQFDIDKTNPEDKFTLQHVYQTASEDEHIGMGHSKYGALARDGISCVVCHQSQPRPQPEDDDRPYLQFFLETSITGNYYHNDTNELYGQFKDDELSPYVMEHVLAMKPKHSDYISSSRMCGTCHTVNLPNVDEPFTGDESPGELQPDLTASENVEIFKKFKHHVEQATYLEWLNSEFENEIDKENPKARSCQDCHMSKGLHDPQNGIDVEQIKTRIAAVQDTTYPDAENLTALDNLNIRMREQGYRRHNFVGLNAFLLEMFNQFDDVLGVRKHDFMTGSRIDVDNMLENFQMTAQNDTADLEVEASVAGRELTAEVEMQNKAGHRFPSGVGFRRAFLEFLVVENANQDDEKIVWSSGQTNELGILLGEDGQPLATEFFAKDATGAQQYQPHYQVITSPDQVQIYETLLWNAKDEFTTSFVHGCRVVKDNRFLPRGWKKEGPDPAILKGSFLKATQPGKLAAEDPLYLNGSGTDSIQYKVSLPAGVDADNLTVRATLYYQALPPYFLNNLFVTAPEGEATRRLHYMLSRMDLKGTAIEDWKLRINGVEAKVRH